MASTNVDSDDIYKDVLQRKYVYEYESHKKNDTTIPVNVTWYGNTNII